MKARKDQLKNGGAAPEETCAVTDCAPVLRENGLSLVILARVLLFHGGADLTGAAAATTKNGAQHGEPALCFAASTSRAGHFSEATAENWESEFLQMAAYVLLTIGLYQRGSSESKDPDSSEAVERDPRNAIAASGREAPGPVRRGGWVLRLYEHSLSLAFVVLFLVSFRAACDRRRAGAQRGRAASRRRRRFTLGEYLGTLAVLVRVVPELAERVPVARRDGRPQHLAAPARVAGIEAGATRRIRRRAGTDPTDATDLESALLLQCVRSGAPTMKMSQ